MEELCSTQLLALLHCVGLGLGLPGAHLELLHPHSIEVLCKKTPQSSGLAPNLSHWEAQAWKCSHVAPEGKFGRKSNERNVFSIVLFRIIWVYS